MKNMEGIPKVSIFIVTYNHENYISQCIDSVLSQVTNFDYEIIIGEDCSYDNTLQICLNYQLEHKNIRLLKSDKNIGLIANWIRSIKACRGKYIAICEGDDFWIDPNKLQIQTDFMDANIRFCDVFYKYIFTG
jgi:glycosyltransferase involved in cell wall biosynthesis